MMHSIQKCNCSVRALELFVRDIGGLEVRSRSIRPFLLRQNRNSNSDIRQISTTSAFRLHESTRRTSSVVPGHTQIDSTATSVEEALEAVSASEQSTTPSNVRFEKSGVTTANHEHNLSKDNASNGLPGVAAESESRSNVSTARLDILPSTKSRVDGRKERKVKRMGEAKRQAQEAKHQEEEAKAVALLEKKRRRRELRRNGATTESTPLPDEGTVKLEGLAATESTSQVLEVPDLNDLSKWQRKKAKARLAAEAVTAEAAPQMTEEQTIPKARRERSRQAASAVGEGEKRGSSANKVTKEKSSGVPVATERGGKRVGGKASEAGLEETGQGQEWEDRRETWMKQKAALDAKFGEQKWNPRKRISPDALAGIRTLHSQQPNLYSTEILADHFKISPEAIRRILRSKWQPDEDAADARRKRWEKRGQKKWEEMVEMGIRPPKKWREMGVGKASEGDVPAWKKKGGRAGGERWIEHPEMDSFIAAGDMAAEGSGEASIGDRIV